MLLLRPRQVTGTDAAVTFIGPPLNIELTVQGASSILVEWDAVGGASEYWIRRYEPGGRITTTGITETSYLDHDLDPSTTYGYRVRAVD